MGEPATSAWSSLRNKSLLRQEASRAATAERASGVVGASLESDSKVQLARGSERQLSGASSVDRAPPKAREGNPSTCASKGNPLLISRDNLPHSAFQQFRTPTSCVKVSAFFQGAPMTEISILAKTPGKMKTTQFLLNKFICLVKRDGKSLLPRTGSCFSACHKADILQNYISKINMKFTETRKNLE